MLFQKAKLGDITPTEDYSQEKADTKSAKVQGLIRYLTQFSWERVICSVRNHTNYIYE